MGTKTILVVAAVVAVWGYGTYLKLTEHSHPQAVQATPPTLAASPPPPSVAQPALPPERASIGRDFAVQLDAANHQCSGNYKAWMAAMNEGGPQLLANPTPMFIEQANKVTTTCGSAAKAVDAISIPASIDKELGQRVKDDCKKVTIAYALPAGIIANKQEAGIDSAQLLAATTQTLDYLAAARKRCGEEIAELDRP